MGTHSVSTVMSNEQCPFCNDNLSGDQPTVALRQKGADTLNQIAGDTIHFVVGQKVHVNCRRDFCRDADRKHDGAEQVTNTPLAPKDAPRSVSFAGKSIVSFVGNPANQKKKGFETIPVRTADLQTTITEICRQRNDEWALTVLGRLEYASDLHAADAVYHNHAV